MGTGQILQKLFPYHPLETWKNTLILQRKTFQIYCSRVILDLLQLTIRHYKKLDRKHQPLNSIHLCWINVTNAMMIIWSSCWRSRLIETWVLTCIFSLLWWLWPPYFRLRVFSPPHGGHCIYAKAFPFPQPKYLNALPSECIYIHLYKTLPEAQRTQKLTPCVDLD